MRIHLLVIAACAAISLTGCGEKTKPSTPASPAATNAAPSPLIARWHFVGSHAFGPTNQAAVFRDVCALPETSKFREQTLTRLSVAAARALGCDTNVSFQLQPLLNDLLEVESFGEIRGLSGDARGVVLAVHLDAGHAAQWSSKLNAALQTSSNQDHTQARTNGWLVLGFGPQGAAMAEETVRELASTGGETSAPAGVWFNITADWTKFAPLLHLPGPRIIPPGIAEFSVSPEGENLRIKGKLTTAQPLAIESTPWLVPTNLIHDPLISFTAVRGIATQLEQCGWFSRYGVRTPPDQCFVWALAQIPFQTFLAAPFADASNTLARIAPAVIEDFRTNAPPVTGMFEYATNSGTLNWTGLPFISPYLSAVKDDTGEFLFAGLFPNNPAPTPMPDELLARLRDRPDLLYYDWEITQERLTAWQNLSQLSRLILGEQPSGTNYAENVWLTTVGQKLGNSITEITRTGSNELSFNRKAPIALTAFELLSLAEWLHSVNFPQFHYPWQARNTNALSAMLSTP